MKRRLQRSDSDKRLGGVCGGLGHYIGVDPSIVRVFFVLLALADGVGMLIYLALWVVLPPEGQTQSVFLEKISRTSTPEDSEKGRGLIAELGLATGRSNERVVFTVGLLLFCLGILVLLKQLKFPLFYWAGFKILWPVAIILIGVSMVVQRAQGE